MDAMRTHVRQKVNGRAASDLHRIVFAADAVSSWNFDGDLMRPKPDNTQYDTSQMIGSEALSRSTAERHDPDSSTPNQHIRPKVLRATSQ